MAARREKFETAYFWQFLRNSPPFLAHRVATIAKIRQFLGGIWTVVQECFLPVLYCLSAAMHLFSSLLLFLVPLVTGMNILPSFIIYLLNDLMTS